MKNSFVLLAMAGALALVATPSLAQNGAGDKHAETALALENQVIFGGDVDKAPNLITEGYVEHHIGSQAQGREQYMRQMKARTELPMGGHKQFKFSDGTTLSSGNFVIFIRPNTHDDPAHPGQMVTTFHYDVFRFEGDKIAEHWD